MYFLFVSGRGNVCDHEEPKTSFKTVSGFQPLAFKDPLLLDNGEGRLQPTLL